MNNRTAERCGIPNRMNPSTNFARSSRAKRFAHRGMAYSATHFAWCQDAFLLFMFSGKKNGKIDAGLFVSLPQFIPPASGRVFLRRNK